MTTTASSCLTEERSADVIIQIAKPVLEQKKLYLITKRAFDIVCSFLGLLILAIPMIIIALIITLDSPGPPIFKQERLGLHGKPFMIYSKENPAWLKLAIESIQDQTLPTSDFVLVCDGPLTPELDGVIAEKHCQMGEILMVVRLEKNVGLGNALNEGIKHCRNELVARMDSDDIAYPDRCEKQVAIFNKYPIVSICSGTVMEFSKNPETINCKRVLPEKNKEIIEFAKKRNPFNHPCVMYKKSAVEAVGSYQHFYLLEDYYLWIRMLMAGYEGYNIQEPLLYMRAGTSMYKRRAGRRYAKTQIELFRFMWKQGFINAWQYAESCIIRSSSALSPNWLRKYMYITFLRS